MDFWIGFLIGFVFCGAFLYGLYKYIEEVDFDEEEEYDGYLVNVEASKDGKMFYMFATHNGEFCGQGADLNELRRAYQTLTGFSKVYFDRKNLEEVGILDLASVKVLEIPDEPV